MSYVKMLEDSYANLVKNKNVSYVTDVVGAESRLAYLSQAVFGFIVKNQGQAESMSKLALSLIHAIKATSVVSFTPEKRQLLTLISNTPFFINHNRYLDPIYDFSVPGNIIWTPTYSRVIEINKNVSTPFVDGDEWFHDLMIGMNDWDCFLNSVIEFSGLKFD